MTSLSSGPFFGHFAYAYDPGFRTPTELMLDVKGAVLSGKGKDQDGGYEVKGTVDGDKVRFTKSYVQGPAKGTRVAYLGAWQADRGELEGRWRIVDGETHGTFAIKPGTAHELMDAAESGGKAVLSRAMGRFRKQLGVDVERLRFDGELAMLGTLLDDAEFVDSALKAKATEAVGAEPAAEDRLLPPRVRLSRATLPDAFLALERCRKTLGLKAPVDLYVENAGELNAFVRTTPDGRIDITITSGVLNAFDVDELCYVIGHEVGHAVLGHLETRVASDEALSGQARLRRLALFRYQELSADRVGLLCCVDVDKAVRAEFMLHTGVVHRDRVGSARALIAGAEQAIARGEGRAVDVEDGYDTHPCGAFRTLAISWFGASSTFAALVGKSKPTTALSDLELERRVQQLVEVMNPSIMSATSSNDELAELVALAAAAVARADKTTSKKETAAIRSLSPQIAAALDRVEALPFEEQQLRTIDLCEKLRMTLKAAARERVLEDLTMVAQADGKISEQESFALGTFALLLDVPNAPDQLLAQLNAGLD